MSSFSKADVGALKAFLTKTEEQFTPKFARNEVVEPRQCVFVGNTNKQLYLKDETGGRRYWPLKVGLILLKALADDRDQLFAEAVVAYRAGEKWWPDPAFEREHIKREQDARFETDAWQPEIEAFLESRDRVQVTEVARGALRMKTERIGTIEQRRIAAVLAMLGWTPIRDWRGRAYVKPKGERP
jgi:predicted P-loop ATPase